MFQTLCYFPIYYLCISEFIFKYFKSGNAGSCSIRMLPMMWLRYFTLGFSLNRHIAKSNSRMHFNSTTMHPTDHAGLNNTAAEIDIPRLAQSHYYFKAGLAVNNYYGLSLVGIGFIENTLSLLVMLQVSNLLRILKKNYLEF